MTIAQIIVAYSVCWWLVLFMVLPHQADAAKNPQTGNAPSAPANPQIRKKCIWTTLIAILPTILVYFAAESAKAEDSIYHASSKGCHQSTTYQPSADVAAKDGYGAGDKKVAPADLNGGSDLYKGDVNIPLQIPSTNYTNPATHNGDLSQSFIDAGKLTVTQNGKTLLNDKPISNINEYSGDCDENK